MRRLLPLSSSSSLLLLPLLLLLLQHPVLSVVLADCPGADEPPSVGVDDDGNLHVCAKRVHVGGAVQSDQLSAMQSAMARAEAHASMLQQQLLSLTSTTTTTVATTPRTLPTPDNPVTSTGRKTVTPPPSTTTTATTSSAVPDCTAPFSFVDLSLGYRSAAADVEAFTIGSTAYLALAGVNETASVLLSASIGGSGHSLGAFSLLQTFSTPANLEWEYFEYNGSSFLAAANNVASGSQIYRFNASSGTFALDLAVGTSFATDWEFFSINDTGYLAAAYQMNPLFTAQSRIFRIVTTSPKLQLVHHQNFSTAAPFGLLYFALEGRHYLAVANSFNTNTPLAESEILRWDPDSRTFQSMHRLSTSRARAWCLWPIPTTPTAAYQVAVVNNQSSSQAMLFNTTGAYNTQTVAPAQGAVSCAFVPAGGAAGSVVWSTSATTFVYPVRPSNGQLDLASAVNINTPSVDAASFAVGSVQYLALAGPISTRLLLVCRK